MPRYSIIIPVYNRPNEVDELLESLTFQTFTDFEVIIVEDGSQERCESVISVYEPKLALSYFYKSNSGPGASRNFGAEQSTGEWLIFLDSDTLIPADYLMNVNDFLQRDTVDAFGGADKDRVDFSAIQRAISYSMTSFLTTGGIRGSKKSMEKFKPRSFNMGIRRRVFHELSGFSDLRYGEDIDFSLRIERAGYKTAYIPDAFVYHKRRTSFQAFYHQVKHSGEARVMLSRLHKGSLKLVHLFPSVFSLGFLCILFFSLIVPMVAKVGILFYAIYFLLIFFDATATSKSAKVGFLAIVASVVQLFAYGFGLLKAGTISILKG